MAQGQLKIATCQFAVGSDIDKNAGDILSYMQRGADEGADIVHFSETALSGYGGCDVMDFSQYNWDKLQHQTEKIIDRAGELGLWVVLGSSHRLSRGNKPYNCLYLINPEGKLQDRYDKRFLTPLDLNYYSAAENFVVFEVNGLKCSLLICFDLRFSELYREIYKLGVDVIFQSFYNARQDGPSVHSDIMRQTMQTRAADNYFWISMSNSSAYYSPYPSCFIRPDGKITGQLRRNRASMMVNVVDAGQQFYDPMADVRKKVIYEKALSYGDLVVDDDRARRDVL